MEIELTISDAYLKIKESFESFQFKKQFLESQISAPLYTAAQKAFFNSTRSQIKPIRYSDLIYVFMETEILYLIFRNLAWIKNESFRYLFYVFAAKNYQIDEFTSYHLLDYLSSRIEKYLPEVEKNIDYSDNGTFIVYFLAGAQFDRKRPLGFGAKFENLVTCSVHLNSEPSKDSFLSDIEAWRKKSQWINQNERIYPWFKHQLNFYFYIASRIDKNHDFLLKNFGKQLFLALMGCATKQLKLKEFNHTFHSSFNNPNAEIKDSAFQVLKKYGLVELSHSGRSNIVRLSSICEKLTAEAYYYFVYTNIKNIEISKICPEYQKSLCKNIQSLKALRESIIPQADQLHVSALSILIKRVLNENSSIHMDEREFEDFYRSTSKSYLHELCFIDSFSLTPSNRSISYIKEIASQSRSKKSREQALSALVSYCET